MSQQALATRSGVDLVRLGDLEAARPGLTTDELRRLAEALQIDSGALLHGDIVERPVPSIRLRGASTRGQDFHAGDLDVLDRALADGRALRELADLLGAPPPLRFARAAAPNNGAANDGYRRAQQVRRALRLALAPLPDLRALLEEQFGIAVMMRKLRTPTPAVAVTTHDAAAVVLNATLVKPGDAVVRVHLAHEASHALSDPLDAGVHVVREALDGDSSQRAEQRARAFAAELLLPLAGLRKILGAPKAARESSAARVLIDTARAHFGTPWTVAAFHLGNHGFIDKQLSEALAEGRPAGSQAQVVTSLPALGAPSILLAERTRRAHDAGHITDGEARGLLGLEAGCRLPWD